MVPTSNKKEEDWSNIRNLLEKVGNEVFGKKRINIRKRGLKIRNEETTCGTGKEIGLSQIPSDKNH